MVDTSGIHSLIGRARRRLKAQSALEALALGLVLTFAAGLIVVFVTRQRWIDETLGLLLLVGCVGIAGIAAVIGAVRRFPQHMVAQRLDRASGLADRLGTACAFEVSLAKPPGGHDTDLETRAMMEAAVRDAVAAAPRANVKAATPFGMPQDTRAAAAFGVVFLLVAGLWWPHDDNTPLECFGLVTLDGKQLPDSTAERGTLVFQNTHTGERTALSLGTTGEFRYEKPLRRGPYRVSYEASPAQCALEQPTMPCSSGDIVELVGLQQHARTRSLSHDLECGTEGCRFDLDIKSNIGKPIDPVAFADDDLDYVQELVNDLRRTARDEKDPSLEQFVTALDELLTKAQNGELTKEQLLEEMKKAEDEFQKGNDPKLDEALADLQETGKELQKDKTTKELGKALEQGDLEKAQKLMEELAKKLENDELSKKEKEQLSKALEKTAEKFEKKDKKREQDLDKQIAQKKDQLEKMKRQLDKEQDQQKKEEQSRRLDKEKRELDKLERKKQERKESQAKRNLKELHRNMKDAAQNMKQQKDQSKEQQQEQQKQASRKMRDMQRNTGKVDQDQRKVQTQKKVASQLTDLREAMRRAKQRGNRGPKDMFGRNSKNRDFGRRARGQKGSGQAWKPGQGKGQGKNGQQPGQGNQPGGKGNQPGGSSYGDGHDPDMMGDVTAKQGDTKDESVSGVHGKGPSTRETILSSAQKGFASKEYEDAYTEYKSIVEEVMQVEKVPSGYKYYIKKYFQKIKPHSMD